MDGLKYEALIFDLDGTLWNANESCTKAWNIFLEKMNYSQRISAAAMNVLTGKPMDEIIDILLPDIRQEHSNIKEILISYEKESVEKNGAEIYPDVLKKVNELSVRFRILIVSNCEKWYLDKFIGFSGLGAVLTDWDCRGSSGLEKHKMIANIRQKHDLKKAIYIGDTQYDKTAAELSESDFIQVTYGFGAPINGVKKFDSFASLAEYLMELPENR